MKNIKISMICSIIITDTAYCSSNLDIKDIKFPNHHTKNFLKQMNQYFTEQRQSGSSNKGKAPDMSFGEKLNAVSMVYTIGKDIYSLFPSKVDNQVVARQAKELEEYNIEFARQREIDQAKRTFYKCCKDNNGEDIDRLTNGLARSCQSVAMDYAALGYREDVEEALVFFNKFRE